MGTKGYLIFKYKGIYYVIYSNNDSYPSAMGVNNARSIKELCQQFNGNIALARDHLGKILEKITFTVDDIAGAEIGSKYYVVLDESADGFDIEEMSQPNAFVCLDEELSKSTPKSDGLFIEYLWEVDIDEGRFGLGMLCSRTVFQYWSWKALYLLSLEKFKVEAELHESKRREGYIIWGTDYEREYKAIVIQAAIRRFLAIRKALQPPNGVLYLKAKKEFEAHAGGASI